MGKNSHPAITRQIVLVFKCVHTRDFLEVIGYIIYDVKTHQLSLQKNIALSSNYKWALDISKVMRLSQDMPSRNSRLVVCPTMLQVTIRRATLCAL